MKNVVIVINGEAITVSKKVFRIFCECAGQMISDGDLYDYYKGNERVATLDGVSQLYREINSKF